VLSEKEAEVPRIEMNAALSRKKRVFRERLG
jgi:hypothetical protein